MTKYQIKRIYDEASDGDGYRVLVDRLWPRGVSKEHARLDSWNKDIAPSSDLRKWFAHDPEKFKEFTARYRAELMVNPAIEAFENSVAKEPDVTLLYAAHDPKINHAVVLRDFLSK
jgi:uncharacterized protein YeaO (DUF488 family)